MAVVVGHQQARELRVSVRVEKQIECGLWSAQPRRDRGEALCDDGVGVRRGERFEERPGAAIGQGQKCFGGGEFSRAVLADEAAAQMLDEVGASRLRGRVGELGAERSDVAGGLVEVDVADHHADAVAVERLVDRHLLLNPAHAPQMPKISMVWLTSEKPCSRATSAAHASTSPPWTSTVEPHARQTR